MRALTALFLTLVLVPAVVLSWLGFRFTVSIEDQARAAAMRETERIISQTRSRVWRDARRSARRVWADAQEAARVIGRRLPFEPRAAVFEDVRASLREGGEIVVRDKAGRVVFPPKPRPLGFERLPEWPAFAEAQDLADAAEFVRKEPLAAARAYESVAERLVTPRLQALALSRAILIRGRHGLHDFDLEKRLRTMDKTVIASAGPAARLVTWDWGLRNLDGPAPAAVVPDELFESLPDMPPQMLGVGGWSIGTFDGPVPPDIVAEAPLPGDCTLELVWRYPSKGETHGDFEISTRRVHGPHRADLVVQVEGMKIGIFVHNRTLDGLEAAAARRQQWTMLGILALLGVMCVGLWVVRRAVDRERAAGRLRDDFIANVSHELKTPLTSVRMYAEMLSAPRLGAAKRKEYGRVIEAEGARLAAMVEDMLDFSALERGTRSLEPEPVDLLRAAEAAADAWRPAADRDGKDFEIEGEGATALADTTALGRILNNLIHNAFKHGGPRVRVVVGPGPRVCVRDDGPGIPYAEQQRIFERFQQGHDGARKGGAGLGLTLSRNLALAMGGELTVDREEEETVFCLTLPPEP